VLAVAFIIAFPGILELPILAVAGIISWVIF
jgi:hypothetical protein